MGLFSKLFGGNQQPIPMYQGEQLEEFLDGFRTGYPLLNQPVVPAHNTKAYRRGLATGKKLTQEKGLPQIEYEESEMRNNEHATIQQIIHRHWHRRAPRR